MVHIFMGSALGVVHLLLAGGLDFTVERRQAHGTALSVWMSLFDGNRFGMELLIYGFALGITDIVRFEVQAQRDAMKSLELQRQLSGYMWTLSPDAVRC